jgi:hypothetical protein
MSAPSCTPVTPSYTLVTPSFRLDFERCRLLVDSVERWVCPTVRHRLIVDRRDVAMFTPLLTGRTQLLVVEDIIPRWLVRVPGLRRFWLSFRTRPLRNWILQQMIKLSIASVLEEDVFLYTDSDVFFVAPFDPRQYEREGRIPLFVETGLNRVIGPDEFWHRVGARLLGLPVERHYGTNYINNVVPWRRENILALQRRIEATAGKSWQLALAPVSSFSEYIIYGMFVQRVLGGNSGHWPDSTQRTLAYWGTVSLTPRELGELAGTLGAEHHSVMISAKSGTPVADIRKAFKA